MNPHFFTALFSLLSFWFRVQGSGLSWRLRRLFQKMIFSYRSLPL